MLPWQRDVTNSPLSFYDSEALIFRGDKIENLYCIYLQCCQDNLAHFLFNAIQGWSSFYTTTQETNLGAGLIWSHFILASHADVPRGPKKVCLQANFIRLKELVTPQSQLWSAWGDRLTSRQIAKFVD